LTASKATITHGVGILHREEPRSDAKARGRRTVAQRGNGAAGARARVRRNRHEGAHPNTNVATGPSRRLERECQRNVELMWLTGRLAPAFKTWRLTPSIT